MVTKIVCTALILIWQIILSVWTHKKYHNVFYDIYNITFQIMLFIIFLLVVWIIL